MKLETSPKQISILFRPSEVDLLLGDASKAREKLGWVPDVRFAGLVRMMVDHDRERRQTEEHYV